MRLHYGGFPVDVTVGVFCLWQDCNHEGLEVKLSPQQMRAMIELLPFHAPKLHSVGVGYLKGEDFPSRLDRAIEASNKAKVIEARAINSEQD